MMDSCKVAETSGLKTRFRNNMFKLYETLRAIIVADPFSVKWLHIYIYRFNSSLEHRVIIFLFQGRCF